MTQIVEEFNYCGQIAAGMESNARRIVNATIRRIEARWKASLSGPRSGRTYRRGQIGRRMTKGLAGMGLRSYQTARGTTMAVVGYKLHRASAPGEAPATDTGNLGSSIYARMTSRLEGEVGATAEYAAALELGGAHVAARPALRPAVKAEWPEFVAALDRLIPEVGR